MSPPKVVALGGGHGLAASLSALAALGVDLTAVVTVADDGGSSGRLRREFGVLPPGDLRMALAALAGDDEWSRTWQRLLQHRYPGEGPLSGHAAGNLVLTALADIEGGILPALEVVGRLLGARGRVLPASTEPPGQPSPCESAIETRSNGAASAAGDSPRAAAALSSRAPSR